MKPAHFDDQMVMIQLKSSSVLSYVEFVRHGFPLRVSIEQIHKRYAPHYHLCANRTYFQTKLLLSIGLRRIDFRIGKNCILFRSDKNDIMQKLMDAKANIPNLRQYLKRSSLIRTRWLKTIFSLIIVLKKGTFCKYT